MNLSIYGLGNRHQRSWLAVDLGVSFGNEEHLRASTSSCRIFVSW